MSIEYPPNNPGEIIGKYKLLQHLGKGAFANVYLATLTSGCGNPITTSLSSPKAMQEKNNLNGVNSINFKHKLASAFGSLSISSIAFPKLHQQPALFALKLCKKSDAEAIDSLKNESKTLLALKSFGASLKEGSTLIPYETAITLKMYQEHIVKVVDNFETDTYFCLCLELIHGKELFECMLEKSSKIDTQEIENYPNSYRPSSKLNKDFIKNIMKAILQGISFIHAAGYAHGDIKLENVMILDSLLTHANCPEIKIIDFGLSTECKDDSVTIEGIPRGSDHYFAPEAVLMMPRNPKKQDIWACGVVMFSLLTLRMPFDMDSITAVLGKGTRRSLARKIAIGKVKWTDEERESIPKESQDIVLQMLTRNSEERPSAAELLNHPYFSL